MLRSTVREQKAELCLTRNYWISKTSVTPKDPELPVRTEIAPLSNCFAFFLLLTFRGPVNLLFRFERAGLFAAKSVSNAFGKPKHRGLRYRWTRLTRSRGGSEVRKNTSSKVARRGSLLRKGRSDEDRFDRLTGAPLCVHL